MNYLTKSLSVLALCGTALLSGCAERQINSEIGAGEITTGESGVRWNKNLMPLNVGDHWVYKFTFGTGPDARTERRVKNVIQDEMGRLVLEDVDGEAYLFKSNDKEWSLRGELDVSDPDHTHYFKPAMVYANTEMFEKGPIEGVHLVYDQNNERTGTLIYSRGSYVGIEEVTLPKIGTVQAVKTTFAYENRGAFTFSIINWMVPNLGLVKRELAMITAEGVERFRIFVELEAARVAGTVFPKGGESFLAKTLFDHARQHRLTVSSGFTGFTADATMSVDGKPIGNAKVDVDSLGEVTVDGSTGDKEMDELLYGTLASRFGHRARMSSRPTGDDVQFELLTDAREDSVGVRNLSDSSMGSNYELIGSRIRVVRRDMGERGKQYLETEKVQWMRKKYVPLVYWWEMRDVEGNVIGDGRTVAEDSYSAVGAFMLPTNMKMTFGGKTYEINLERATPKEAPAAK